MEDKGVRAVPIFHADERMELWAPKEPTVDNLREEPLKTEVPALQQLRTRAVGLLRPLRLELKFKTNFTGNAPEQQSDVALPAGSMWIVCF